VVLCIMMITDFVLNHSFFFVSYLTSLLFRKKKQSFLCRTRNYTGKRSTYHRWNFHNYIVISFSYEIVMQLQTVVLLRSMYNTFLSSYPYFCYVFGNVQQEYIRGISAWNFNIEDLKNQAAHVCFVCFNYWTLLENICGVHIISLFSSMADPGL